MRKVIFVLILGMLTLISGCDFLKSDSDSVKEAPPPQSAANSMPDVGAVERIKVQAEGVGDSAAEAVSEAMKMAILQVNGATIDTATVGVKYGLDVTLGRDSASLRASEFAAAVVQRSGGAIQGFKLLELKEPGLLSKTYKAVIEAEIAKYKASKEIQKIKLVVAPVRFDSGSVKVGDRIVSSDELSAMLHQRITSALVATGRFAILDRSFSDDIDKELESIYQGAAPSSDMAKTAQAVAADLVWSARVTSFDFARFAKQKTGKAEKDHSSSWGVTQKLVNVSTRQVMNANYLKGVAPVGQQSTVGSSDQLLDDMLSDLSAQVVGSILRSTFPITVVSRDGMNVVLSQGGQALREGARYQVVAMGDEITDPQTGQKLGRTEKNCCELVIERVTPNLSYGYLEKVTGSIDNMSVAALQVRDEVRGTVATADTVSKASEKAEKGAATTKSAKKKSASGTSSGPAPINRNDDRW